MPETDDIALLKQYAESHSEAAFSALVERYVHLVYSIALRQVGNPSHAEEISQAVFIILTQKAKSLGPRTILSGWLYQTARLTAANFMRSEIRRQQREQEAYMESLLTEPTPNVWQQIAPLLDDAMGHLSEKDRNVFVLRYFQNKSAAEIGDALGIDSSTAQKRITRAVRRLRKFFAKRSVAHSAESITGAISTNSVQGAPAGLAATISAAAVKSSAVAASTLTLVKGALKLMAWAKMKTAAVVGIAALLAVGTTATFWHFHFGKDSWRSRFDSAYKLKDGETIRYIAPPYIPERAEYYHTEERLQAQAKAVPRGPDFFIFKQDKSGQLQYSSLWFGYKQHSIQQTLGDCFGFWRYEFEGPEQVLNLNLPGDWTIREDANREALLAALEPILFKATGHKILFEKRAVEREVIVAHGSAKSPETKVQIYAEKKGKGSGMGHGSLQQLLGKVGEQLNIYVVNEAQIDPLYADLFDWADYPDSNYSKMGNRREELTDKVLQNLTTQTGLTFTREQRPVDIWFITEQP
jgi:RNA polymerase sigma factor (sigma-70 family)